MQLALAQRGVSCGLRRLTHLMREHGWLHERRRRPKGLTKPDPQAMAAENLLHQDFSADRPWRKLLTDIFIYYNQYRVYTSNQGGLPPAAFRISALGYAA